MTTLQTKFQKEIAPLLMKEFGLKNKLAAPSTEKVVVNMGIGRLITQNSQTKDKILEQCIKLLAAVTGQRPAPRKAKISIAGFKLRQGETIGLIITLRGSRMYDFLSRLIHVALPRTRDFRGIPLRNVDEHGALTIGIREHIVFPEVASEETKQLYGFQVTIVPTTRKRERAIALYRALGIPLQKE